MSCLGRLHVSHIANHVYDFCPITKPDVDSDQHRAQAYICAAIFLCAFGESPCTPYLNQMA